MAKAAKKVPVKKAGNGASTKAKTTESDAGNKTLSEIRQLLFGEEVAAIRQNIEKNHVENQKTLSKLTDSFNDALVELKSYVDDHFESLKKSISEFDSSHNTKESSIDEQLSSIQGSLERIRKWSETKHSDIYNELESKHEQVLKQLDKTANELKANKADRKTLAALLATVATNLEDE